MMPNNKGLWMHYVMDLHVIHESTSSGAGYILGPGMKTSTKTRLRYDNAVEDRLKQPLL